MYRRRFIAYYTCPRIPGSRFYIRPEGTPNTRHAAYRLPTMQAALKLPNVANVLHAGYPVVITHTRLAAHI